MTITFRLKNSPPDDQQRVTKSLVVIVFFVLRKRSIGAADGSFGIPGTHCGNHPKGAFKIIAWVTNTRSLNPPNQHGTHTPNETVLKLAV